ncbi:MAG: rhodanese-like domain-containing protein [Gammaproteobacteria bacterium]|nr:rhodanese-like domain-containing protein [Gammaproteobacteria bacterium]
MAKTVEDLVRAARAAVSEIDVARARELQATGVTFVDVREPAECEKGIIEGAVCIPRGVLEWKAGAESRLADRAAPVVVYCQSGGRSALAAVALGELGWSDVKSLAGGYAAWRADD